jgi:hypothetical protein
MMFDVLCYMCNGNLVGSYVHNSKGTSQIKKIRSTLTPRIVK